MAEAIILETMDRLDRGPIPLTHAVRALNAAAGQPVVSYDKARRAYMDGRLNATQSINGRFSLTRPQFEGLVKEFAPELQAAL